MIQRTSSIRHHRPTLGFAKRRTPIQTWSLMRISVCLACCFFVLVRRVGGVWGSVIDRDVERSVVYGESAAILTRAVRPEWGEAMMGVIGLVRGYIDDGVLVDASDTSQRDAFWRNRLPAIVATGAPERAQLIDELRAFDADLLSLVGIDRPQTYLILLMNMSERRPNGGFFGSYLRVTIDRGTVTERELHDAYYPGSVKKTKIDLPAHYEPLIPHLTTRFISANQFGFTGIDAKQLIQIYEETFPDDPIRGVVFVASDAIEELLPSYTAKHREFEFINASADLIAGHEIDEKKKKYRAEMTDYIEDNIQTIVRSLLDRPSIVLGGQHVHLYLTDVSTAFGDYLVDRGLTETFDPSYIYLWDENKSFSKIDKFVTKHAYISDNDGNVIASLRHHRIDVSMLQPAKSYTLTIVYTLNLPRVYEQFVHELVHQYDIELTEREEHILGLTYLFLAHSAIVAPPDLQISALSGSSDVAIWEADDYGSRRQYLSYVPSIETNNTSTTQTFALARKNP